MRDDRGVLGSRRRGAVISRMRGGANLSDPPADEHHYLRPAFYSHLAHKRGPVAQRVPHLTLREPQTTLQPLLSYPNMFHFIMIIIVIVVFSWDQKLPAHLSTVF